MTFEPTPLSGSFLVRLKPFADERGWFVRTYSKDEFNQAGFSGEWVQMNHSYTATAGTIRGMHYQVPPFREVKLVRCIRGSVWDVIVDLRENSPTFLQWFGTELSEHDMTMLYIPEGFAHGFQSLTDHCELIYHHSVAYKPGYEGGIRYDDSRVGISWKKNVTVISDRDKAHAPITRDFKGI
jgi:dTDP-4-dehydrorhamnose 3,5-epimerase